MASIVETVLHVTNVLENVNFYDPFDHVFLTHIYCI